MRPSSTTCVLSILVMLILTAIVQSGLAGAASAPPGTGTATPRMTGPLTFKTKRGFIHIAPTRDWLLRHSRLNAANGMAATGGNLINHGGDVMPSLTAYLIFWLAPTASAPGGCLDPVAGSYANGNTDSTYRNLMARFITDLNGTPYFGML